MEKEEKEKKEAEKGVEEEGKEELKKEEEKDEEEKEEEDIENKKTFEIEKEEIKNEEEILKECDIEKCQFCDEFSKKKNVCTKCNNKKGYYLINNNLSKKNNENYFDCINELKKPSNFYFNKESKTYEPCYYTCSTCNYGGDGNVNNCSICLDNLIFKPDILETTNCVQKCEYFYYYTIYNQYKCTEFEQCPVNYTSFIKEKNKCINNCEKDYIYKYQYNGECFKECPNNTTHGDNEYLCKDININKCKKTESYFKPLANNISNNEIERITKNYANEFKYTDNHISIYNHEIYSITLYKNTDCISELNLTIPQINFGECYKKIKENYHIEENLIIAIISKKINGIPYQKNVIIFNV